MIERLPCVTAVYYTRSRAISDVAGLFTCYVSANLFDGTLKWSTPHCAPEACALRACSCKPGAVPADFSRSAAHSAAPTVFVKANTRLANGISSRRNETTPNLFPRFSKTLSRHAQLTMCILHGSAPQTPPAVSSSIFSTGNTSHVLMVRSACLVRR